MSDVFPRRTQRGCGDPAGKGGSLKACPVGGGFSRMYTQNMKNQTLAPEVGLEPTTTRLTAACSTIELLWNANGRITYK